MKLPIIFLFPILFLCANSPASATWAWKPAEAAMTELASLLDQNPAEIAISKNHEERLLAILQSIPDGNFVPPSGQTKAETILELINNAQRAAAQNNHALAKQYCKEIIVRFRFEGKALNERNRGFDYYPMTWTGYKESIELNGVAQALLLLAEIVRWEGSPNEAVILNQEIVTYYTYSFVYDTR